MLALCGVAVRVLIPRNRSTICLPGDGERKRCHDNGQLASVGHFLRGRGEGARVEWWPSGMRTREANYRAGELDGTVREWDETGKAVPDQEWRAGVQAR